MITICPNPTRKILVISTPEEKTALKIAKIKVLTIDGKRKIEELQQTLNEILKRMGGHSGGIPSSCTSAGLPSEAMKLRQEEKGRRTCAAAAKMKRRWRWAPSAKAVLNLWKTRRIMHKNRSGADRVPER
ncbi:hypothetical protein MTO96_000409 [Rhipicephalus appendiculatus]